MLSLCAGWGNTGFGATLLLMPLLYKAFNLLWGPQIAWRAVFFVPGGLQLIAGMLVLVLADDTPEGRLSELQRCVPPCVRVRVCVCRPVSTASEGSVCC